MLLYKFKISIDKNHRLVTKSVIMVDKPVICIRNHSKNLMTFVEMVLCN